MRGKLKRFAEVEVMDNVIQEGKSMYSDAKGNWNVDFFAREQPIVLELACGRGEYTIGLARVQPLNNYIGIDIKGDRIWKGAKTAQEEGMDHVGFLRTPIQKLEDFFAPSEVSEIWVTFPDPRPKDRDEKHRLTNNAFLDIYKKVLQPDGWIKFKTDNTFLFNYTLECIEERKDIIDLQFTHDLYSSDLQNDHFGIKTRFEQKFSDLGEKIKYMKFRFARD